MLNTDAIKSAVSIEGLIGQYVALKKQGSEYLGLCPFHSEKTPSFTVTPAKGMWYCFGCQTGGDAISFIEKHEAVGFEKAAIIAAEFAGISVAPDDSKPTRKQRAPKEQPAQSKLIATYRYEDESGALLYEVQRWEPGRNGQRKDFRQRRPHPDGGWIWGLKGGKYARGERGDWYRSDAGDEILECRRVLYRLPKVIAAEEVWIVEGEKDVHTLESLGFVATTNSGGSGQDWLPEYTEVLRGKRVVIVPDADATGEKHGRKIEVALKGATAELVYLSLPPGVKDVTEYVESGGNRQSLLDLAAAGERAALEQEFEHRGLLTPTEILTRFEGGYNAFIDVTKRPKGLLTGFYRLDDLTLGLHPGELFVLAARPAMGKTAMALGISHAIAQQDRGVVAIFSLEMSSSSLLQRLMCAGARIDSLKFRSGYCTQEELYTCQRELDRLSGLPLMVDDTPALTLSTMRRKLLIVCESSKLALVVLDYLQLALGSTKVRSAANRVAEVSELTRGLKLLAREFKVPFLVLSQLSRKCEDRPGDHRPLLGDLRESGSIEQDADTVAFIWRGEVYRPDKEELRGIAELILAKQRNGPTGTVKLAFLNRYTKFENLCEEVV